jgi:predicted transcriptional regulator
MQMNALQNLYIQSPKLNQLNILREVSANPRITQAELAQLCSLSVAMVNNYMKELCGSGLLEYHRKTSKSVTYHLTSAGERSLELLQMELMDEMVGMFVAAKEQIRARIMSRAQTSFQRVVLYGSGHFAQLAFHALELAGVNILGVCDDNPAIVGREFCGRAVLSPAQIRFIAPDAVIIADSLRTEEIYANLNYLSNYGIAVIRLDSPPQTPIEPPNALQPSAAAPDHIW